MTTASFVSPRTAFAAFSGFVIFSLLCVLLLCQSAQAQQQAQIQAVNLGTLPATIAQSLDERQVYLPREFPAERTLVLLAFERDQRAVLATWKAGLELQTGWLPWIELVVVGQQNAFVRSMITRGLRRENPEGLMRDRTVPLFGDQEAFAASLGLSTDKAYVLTVDRSGKVLARAQGGYAVAKAQPLLTSLKP